MLVISYDVWGAHPFVGGGAGGVGDVVALFVFQAQKTADVVQDAKVIGAVNNQRLFVVACRQATTNSR